MAETDFGSLTAAQKKVWSEWTWIQGRNAQFWFKTGMMGSGSNDDTKPIQLITELTATGRGDRCVMQLVCDLQTDGVAGDAQLEGNEEPLINDEQEIVIDQLRNAVKNKGEMSEQRTVLRFRSLGKNKLAFWLADKLDEMTFLTASSRAYSLLLNGATRVSTTLPSLAFASSVTPSSSGRVKFPVANSEGTITASELMSWKFLVALKAYAIAHLIKPMRVEGQDTYCVVMSPYQARDLKTDSDYMTNVGRAGNRGTGNDLFKGSFAQIDGLVLYEHNKVYNTGGLASGSKWGSAGTVEGAQALLLGAQAIGYARIGDAFWRESDLTDYGNKVGIGYGRKVGLLKPQFRSVNDNNTTQDFGIIAVKTAAVIG